jgi:hypothetical protein
MSDPDDEVVAFKVMMEITHEIYDTPQTFHAKWRGQERDQGLREP